MINGTIFNIQRFSLHDGPGIRTTVFLKGCPLNCIWCHNPESQKTAPQLAWIPKQCIGCQKCESVCNHNVHTHLESESGKFIKKVAFENCIACGRCVEVCPNHALEISGKKTSATDVIEEVKKDLSFYQNSGGGLTLSGGEAALQPAFTRELLRLAKESGIHTALETAGFISWHIYESFLPNLDMVLFDIKQMDSKKHQEYIGQPNEPILDNLKRFCAADRAIDVVVRIPVIPGYNDQFNNYENLASFLLKLERIPRVEMLPYNPLAGTKHSKFGLKYTAEVDEKNGNRPEDLCRLLLEKGLQAKIIR